jgi:hypothetical protein
MAVETVAITAGSGTPICADKVNETDYMQVVKLGLGADGALDNVVDAGSQVSSASIPVVLASDHADVKVTLDSEAVTANLGATDNAVLDAIATYTQAIYNSTDSGGPSTTIYVTPTESTSNPYKNIDVDESEDAVSASQCIVKGFTAYNLHASDKRYLKLYNAGTGDVTVGTTVPTMTFPLAAGQGMTWSTPLLFATALTVAATTGVADNDSGAPGANEVVFNCGYIAL